MAATSASAYSPQRHFTLPKQASILQQHHSSKSSCSSILFKSLLVMLVLVVIPIFPSQAPDFITQSIVTQFWELFHLMFIGIAVCYGLFCKRSISKTFVETHSRFDAYPSGISNVPSIFDNGLENFCEFDEKRVVHNWDSQFLQHEKRDPERFELVEGEGVRSFSVETGAERFCGSYDKRMFPNLDSQFFNYETSNQERFELVGGENITSFSDKNGTENFCLYGDKRVIASWDSQFLHYENMGQESSDFDESVKSKSFSDTKGVENMDELNEGEVSQVWNSQYFVGESMVVVANGNYGVEKSDHIDHKPLGLPVRSLRYRANSAEKVEPINGNTAGSRGYEVRGERIRGTNPINLGEKFEEASGPGQVSWRSRSQRGDRGVNTVTHSRPHSVGQLEFGHLKPRSLHKPVSPQTSPTSSSPRITSPSSSCSSENESTSMSTSQPTAASVGEEAVLTSRNESYSEMNVQLRNDEEMNMNRSSKEACHVQGETESEHLEPWSFWKHNHSQVVSDSFSPGAISPIYSGSPELPNFRKQDLERLKVVNTPSPQLSQSTERSENDAVVFVASKTRPSTLGSSSEFDMHRTSKDKLNKVAPVNGEATFLTSKSRSFSIASSSEVSMQESSTGKPKHVKEDDTSSRQIPSVNSLVLDTKQPLPANTLSRGKSVRTFRSRRSYMDRSKRKGDRPKESGEINEVSSDQSDTVSSTKSRGEKAKSWSESSGFSEIELEAKQPYVNMNIVESKENSESVLTKSHLSSDEEEVGSFLVDDAEPGSEVDRKAGEFIAKFREQIRLQKIESFRRSSG